MHLSCATSLYHFCETEEFYFHNQFQDETLPYPRSRSCMNRNPMCRPHPILDASGRKVFGCCDIYLGTTQCRAPLATGLGFRWRGGSRSCVASHWTPEFGSVAFSMALSNASWQLCPRHDSFERFLSPNCRSLMLMHVCTLSGNAWTVGTPRKDEEKDETGLFTISRAWHFSRIQSQPLTRLMDLSRWGSMKSYFSTWEVIGLLKFSMYGQVVVHV